MGYVVIYVPNAEMLSIHFKLIAHVKLLEEKNLKAKKEPTERLKHKLSRKPLPFVIIRMG